MVYDVLLFYYVALNRILDDLSQYYFSRSFVAREIKNLEFISMK